MNVDWETHLIFKCYEVIAEKVLIKAPIEHLFQDVEITLGFVHAYQ